MAQKELHERIWDTKEIKTANPIQQIWERKPIKCEGQGVVTASENEHKESKLDTVPEKESS